MDEPRDDFHGGYGTTPVPGHWLDGTAEAVGLLQMLNASRTTHAVLDHDAGLNRRAADALIGHRDGPDGVYGSGDDDRYDTVSEVYDVSGVGDATVDLLLDYAVDAGYMPVDSALLGFFEGVAFTVQEAEMTLTLVNSLEQFQLNGDVALDSRAAEAIVANRPVYTLPALAAIDFVGADALEKLRAYAHRYLNSDLSDGSFVLTRDQADYYLEVMTSVLRDDREFFEQLLSRAATMDEVDRILAWVEVELEREIDGRVGQVFPSEQELLDQLFALLERLQERASDLLLN